MALKPLNSVGGFSVGEIPANVILANADITANKATFNGNVLISPANNAAYGILTDNLYYANGVPWDMQQAAGSNGELQFNLNDDFAASANLLWDNANSNLTITGNANVTGTLIAGTIETDEIKNGTSNVAIPVASGNVNISAAGTANVLAVTGTGVNVAGTFNTGAGNANVGNLGTDTAIITTGNITTINSGLLQNGTTNVTLTPSGNVATYIAGNATAQLVVASTGVNVAGYANIVGNANIGNIGTAELVATGNITGANLMGPLANGTSNVSIPAVNGNVNVTVGGVPNVLVVTGTGVNVAGTLNTGAGNANVGNLGTDTAIITTGNITTINSGLMQNGTSNVTITGSGNISTYVAGNATAQLILTSTGANIAGYANVAGNANVGNLGTNQIVTTGNISISNATPTNGLLTDNLYYSNGVPWDLQEPAGNTTEVQFNNNGQFGASANFTFNNTTNVLDVNGNLDVSDTAIIQGNVRTPNIQSAGNLTVTTDFGVDNNQFVFTDTGNVVMPGNTKIVNTSGNISIQSGGLGKYAELLSGDANTAIWVEDSPDGAYIGANLTGTPVTWNFKTNGDLVTNPGNITIGANGNIVASTFIGDLEGNVTTTVGNTFVLFSDDGQITGASGFTFDKLSNLVTMTGNLNLGPSGENQVINLSSTALEVRGGWNSSAGAVNIVAGDYSNSTLWGKLSIQGNVSGNSVGYSEANVFVFTTPGAGAGNVVRVDTLNTAAANTTSGALQVAGGLGVTGNGYFGNLSVTGDIANANNISVTNTLAANVGNFSGNITSLNANLGNLVDANIIRTGQLYNGNSNIALTANGNILFSVEGLANVHTFSKNGVNVVGYVEANGNGTFGSLHSNTLTAQGGNVTIYAAAGNNYVELRPTGTGQVDVGNFRIQNLGTPNAGADAATKAYVDNAIEGLTWKQAAQLLSNANVALSGTTNTLVIDGYTPLTSADNGYRIVLINQTPDTDDGIYVYNDTGNGNYLLTRSADADTYQELEGAAIFILEGNTYANTGWTQTNHYLTDFGNQQWVQFAGGGAYTGANGISVIGTIISANTDGITTEIAGGNIVVKANAQFTTPDIGAATGTSLNLTGNALVNNLNSNLKVTTTDLEATGNIIAANISANANLLVANATVNLHLSGNTANFTGNVILPNVTVNLELAGNTANFTGNLIAANVQANGLANVGNLNVVSNVTSDLLPNANLTLDLGASAQRWDNVYAGNLDASGNLVVAGSFSANTLTGNVLHANNQVEIGNTKIIHGEVTTTTTTANQTIATFTQSGITGVEYLVKGMDAAGSKYTVATVVAVTDGANVDYSTFATVIIGGTTGTLAVNINGSNIDLQVTPSSSNSTVWVTQYRTI